MYKNECKGKELCWVFTSFSLSAAQCTGIGKNIPLLEIAMEPLHSRDQQLFQFIGTKESFYIRKRFNFHMISLGHQHGLRFIVLVLQYGGCGVM